MITFHVAPKSAVATYLQLAEQVRQALLNGVLRQGDQLPTVKDVVQRLAINPNTVLKAYRELEAQGLVEGRQGVGTFVVRRPEGPPPATHVLLSRQLASWVTKARKAGMGDGDIESMLRSVLALTSDEAIA